MYRVYRVHRVCRAKGFVGFIRLRAYEARFIIVIDGQCI